jgi:protocatechuate 3,4-dioxygenase beta subunit
MKQPRSITPVVIALLILSVLSILAACAAPAVAPAAATLQATSTPEDATDGSPTLAPTEPPVVGAAIECTGIPTIAQTEGPMYVPNPPQRSNLRADPRNAGGQPLILTGAVVNRQCQPIADAVVDIWHTDAQGEYDLSESYTSRGYTLTDADGKFRFETIFPFIYMGRTAHIHVKITPPGGATLTTQLYFPNEATNSGDAIFEPSLLVTLSETPEGQQAEYTFVME